MSQALIAIVTIESKKAAEAETTLEGRLTAAMKAAKNHWMVTDENIQFKGAVQTVYELSDEETKERIEAELKSLQALSAMCAGVAVDISNTPIPENPIGILKVWRES